jgi:outer membrane protein assembly factor BamD
MRRTLWMIPVLAFVVWGCAKPALLSKAKTAEVAFEECHSYTTAKSYDIANECFELLRSRFPGTAEAVEAEIETADNYYRQKDYLVAVEAYKNFARLHPTYERVDYVYYRIGQSYFKESPKAIDRDQQYLGDAIHYFTLTMNYPASIHKGIAREKWTEARRRIAERAFYVGRFYYRMGEFISAIPRFEEIVTKYSELGFDEKALYYLGRSYLELGEKDKSINILEVFDKHFPKSQLRGKLAKRIGV